MDWHENGADVPRWAVAGLWSGLGLFVVALPVLLAVIR